MSGEKMPLFRPIDGPEDLSGINELDLPPVEYELTVENQRSRWATVSAVVTTNIPTNDIRDISLNRDVPVVGFSSLRYLQPREAYKGGEAEVIVCDYGDFGRTIIVHRACERKAHIPGDALGSVLTVNPEGRVVLGVQYCDGNSNVYIPDKFVKKEHTVIKRNGKGGERVALIEAFGSPTYADLGARNALRIPPFIGKLRQMADIIIERTHRKPDLMYEYGGATMQSLAVEFDNNSPTMRVENLNLGETKDLGGVMLPTPEGPRAVNLTGNMQDLSFEGKIDGYDPANLVMTVDGLVMPTGLIAMVGDGFRLPSATVAEAKGESLQSFLQRLTPAEIVDYFSKGVDAKLGTVDPKNRYDDGSLFIYVPCAPKKVEETPVTAVESIIGVSQADTSQTGEGPVVDHPEGDDKLVPPQGELASNIETKAVIAQGQEAQVIVDPDDAKEAKGDNPAANSSIPTTVEELRRQILELAENESDQVGGLSSQEDKSSVIADIAVGAIVAATGTIAIMRGLLEGRSRTVKKSVIEAVLDGKDPNYTEKKEI